MASKGMEFIKLNGKKFIGIFFLCFFASVVFVLFLYLIRKDKTDVEEVNAFKIIGPLLAIGFTSLFFSLYFFVGMLQFYQAKKSLSYIASLHLFDTDNYSRKYIYQDSWIFYVRECLSGFIDDYPVDIIINYQISKSVATTVACTVFIVKFKHNHGEFIHFPTDWLGRPREGIKEGIINFVSELKMKGYDKGVRDDLP